MSRALERDAAGDHVDASPAALGMFTLDAGHRPEAQPGEDVEKRVVLVMDFEARALQPLLGHALHGLAPRLIQRHQRVPRSQALDRLHAFMAPHAGCAVAVVMRLPDDPDRCDWPRDAIESVMAALVDHPGVEIDLAVAVTQAPRAWSGLRAVRHFIAAGDSGTVRATASATRMVASLMAPYALLEADVEEMRRFLGTAWAPSRLFHCRWSDATATMSLEADPTMPPLAQASACLLLNEGGRCGGPMARSLLRQWHAWCPLADDVLAGFTHDFFESRARPEEGQHIVAICRFDGAGGAGEAPDAAIEARPGPSGPVRHA